MGIKMEELIENYLKLHYRKFYNSEIMIKVIHVEDKGYYYQFHVCKDKVIYLKETIMKLDLELST